MENHYLGLIINPVAGLGGRVGLKGSDGRLSEKALSAGAVADAGRRATIAVSELRTLPGRFRILTCDGEMGADAIRQAGLVPTIVNQPAAPQTTAADTIESARRILQYRPRLLLFAGGDGTARDLLDVVNPETAVLGIPAGVKMHSSVFAASARAAGQVARRFLLAADPASMLHDAEVMDRELPDKNEQSLSPRLYGHLRVPRASFLVPGAKSATRLTDEAALAGALQQVRTRLTKDRLSLLGPGSTMQAIKQSLGFDGTLLGVDALLPDGQVATDLGEREILELVGNDPARIVVSVVGGQGFLFGRGNQQLSPKVIRTVGTDNIVVVASLEKLLALPEGKLLVDSGDDDLDRQLAGFIPVQVSASRSVVMPVASASAEDDDCMD